MQNQISNKLHAFIRKYNTNMLVRGLLISVALMLSLYLLLSYGEYWLRFGSTMRKALFFGFVIAMAIVAAKWIILPLSQLYNLRKSISNKQAAKIIGTHFENVKDKLLNLLELEEQAKNGSSNALLLAAIEQKTEQLRPIPFAQAIKIKESNKKWIKMAVIPVALLLLTLLVQSSIITDGTKRIIAFNKDFPIPPPFNFELQNKTLQVYEGENLEIKLRTTGTTLPANVEIAINQQRVGMRKDSLGNFSYTLGSVKQNSTMQFWAAGYNSPVYAIEVLKLPSLSGFEVQLNYPAYTGKKSEKLSSNGEITCPEGTAITWQIKSVYASHYSVNGNIKPVESNGKINFTQRVLSNANTAIKLYNKLGVGRDSIKLKTNVIPDAAPAISAETSQDSSSLYKYFFYGTASDDYGISKVSFIYTQKNKSRTYRVNLPIAKNNEVAWAHALDLKALGLNPGEEITYYIEAWDNNGVRGPQVSRTSPKTLRRKTQDELRDDAIKNENSIKNSMAGAMSKTQELKKQNNQLQGQMNQQKKMNWQQENKLDDLLKQQEELNKMLEKIKQNNEQLQEQKEDFMKPENELDKREEQLNKALDEVKNPEMEKLLEEIRKLMEQNAPKEQIQRKMQEMQKQNQEVFKNLDALKEQFKQLQLERILEDQIEQIKKLTKEQESLKQATEKGIENSEKLGEKQKQLEQKLKETQEALKQAEELNKELQKPMEVDLGKKEAENAEQNMKKSEENLKNNDKKESKKEQENAIDQLQKMSDKLQKSLQNAREKQMAEDYKTTRELLDNLVLTSHEQEGIFLELAKLREYGPRYVKLNTQQMKVREKCAILEDSLRMLAKRQPMVSTFITQEINRINTNMDDALDLLRIRNLSTAAAKEQFVMTGLNNLAVMLMESMQNMQSQMNKGKSKSAGACKNPGQGQGEGQSPGKTPGQGQNGKLSDAQKQLGEMMQKLQQEGQGKSGEGKQGQDGKQGENGSGTGGGGGSNKNGDNGGNRQINKEYAQIALMQEALRRKVEQMKQELLKQGNTGAAQNLQKIEKMMDQNERELVKKQLSNQTIIRQKEILTRLLEHEKSERTQGQDEQRSAEKPKINNIEVPQEIQKHIQELKNQREMLRKISPQMQNYYKNKTEIYLQKVN